MTTIWKSIYFYHFKRFKKYFSDFGPVEYSTVPKSSGNLALKTVKNVDFPRKIQNFEFEDLNRDFELRNGKNTS